MQEILEEYGEFIIEAVGSILFLGILGMLFFGTPIRGLILKFIASAVGGAV